MKYEKKVSGRPVCRYYQLDVDQLVEGYLDVDQIVVDHFDVDQLDVDQSVVDQLLVNDLHIFEEFLYLFYQLYFDKMVDLVMKKLVVNRGSNRDV